MEENIATEMMKRSSTQETYGKVQSAIRILALFVFVGWIFIWIMIPTNTYTQNWFPHLQAKTTSIYFGEQGARTLINTFPVILIAVLGCVYLHLAKKSNGSNMDSCDGKKHKASIWKRPMLIKGPLGIVCGTEIVFLVMFIALLIWSFAIYLYNDFASITPESEVEYGAKVWELKLESVAQRLGVIGNICLAFLFFPVIRSSSVLPLFGLTSENSIKYHIWLGHIVMILFTSHGLCYIIYWALTNQISEMLKWDKEWVSNVAGELALAFGLFMWIATIPRIRRKMFELFFYTHILYILFIIFFIFHVGISNTCIMLPGFYLFLVDRYLRFLQSRHQVHLISARILSCETVELNFSKGHELTYNPTSTMFLNIPSISKLQWHPFTVTSNSNLEQEKLSVVIKSEGTWTQKLYKLLSSPSTIDRLGVSIEGPYGPASTNYLRYDILVLISGGSGITPFISIIREFIFLNIKFKCKTPKIMLIYVFRRSSYLSMIDLILPISTIPYDISNLKLQIEAYITKDKEPKLNSQTYLQTKWFKPNPTDTPIYATLGSNSWLWLGAIISSSFIIFLIIIGIIIRYYIFPIEHNSNNIFPSPLKSFLHMLIICVSIAMVVSAAFLLNKKHNAKEEKNIHDLGGSTSIVSPSSMSYNTDRELESLPCESLVQATNVHYGIRPDLKRLLFEIKGSSVGVLVAGPKKMREDVAAICSSDLAENLHFESISFSW
ncbi:PREDICTED: ferric reduction oxidase 2-like [Lupinus angustifolius]|uniref:ferric reduction oxidase 2-like n=1 Tax=Lupinus angustifolius TaxID=3871 RepID=UPI00092FB1C7|nr:PREDICTED: ferric reduction oxidase 2-like [Lupinus angustifolius]